MYKQTEKINGYYDRANMGEHIYNAIMDIKPNKVREFGTQKGYVTLTILQAFRDLGRGKLESYDIVQEHLEFIKEQIVDLDIDDNVSINFDQIDFYEWIKEPEDYDLLIVDVNNDKSVVDILGNLRKPIIFEGGSQERDRMTNRNCNGSKVKYDLLTEEFPSFSIIR